LDFSGRGCVRLHKDRPALLRANGKKKSVPEWKKKTELGANGKIEYGLIICYLGVIVTCVETDQKLP